MTSQLLGFLLLFPVLLTSGLFIRIFRDRHFPGVTILAGFLVGVMINSVSYAVELISRSLEAKLFWHGGYYLGLAIFLPFLLWFAIHYNPNREGLSNWQIAALFIPGFLIWLVYSTNDAHHLFYNSVWLDSSGAIPSMQKTNGPIYWISISWIYFSFLAANWIVFGQLKRTPPSYRKQIWLLGLSMLAPVLAGILYLVHVRPFGFLNLAVIANSITGFFCALIIYHYRLLDLTPIAYRFVFEKIPLGVIVVDPLGLIVNINPVALADFGVREEDILGQPIESIRLDRRETLRRLIALDQPEAQEFHWHRADTKHPADITHPGEAGRVIQTTRTLLMADKTIVGQVILLRDITERKRQEQSQIENERLSASMLERERLANEIHDGIAQVLGYTCAQVEAAQAYLQNSEISLAQATLTLLGEVARDAHADIRTFILGMKADTKHPADINDSTETSPGGDLQTAAGQTDVLCPHPAQGASFCSALTTYCTQFTHLYGLPIKLSIPSHCPEDLFESISETNVLRIVQEALTNVRKHAQASSVEITLLVNVGEAVIFIHDNGCGFLSSEIPTQPLQPDDPSGELPAPAQTEVGRQARAENGREKHFGLQIMRARAAEINGRLEIRSNTSMGTQVILHAPRRKLDEPGRLTPMNVLLVDDQPLFRNGLRNLLRARGLHVVGEANNGAEAVRLAGELRPTLILMDYHMPVMDGLEATRQIKALLPETRIVMLTVNEDRDLLFKAMNSGASGYLLKDLKPDEFFGMLEMLIHGETPISARLTGQLLSCSVRAEAMQTEIFISDRQLKFLQLASRGMTHREIADTLHMSESTVKYHFKQIFELLDVHTRDEALVVAAKRGWIERRGGRT